MKQFIFLIMILILSACAEVKVKDITEGKNIDIQIQEPQVVETQEEAETEEVQEENTTETEVEEEAETEIATKKPELIILISDDAPISDIMWATELAQEIQFTALENKKISKRFSYKSGFSRMYSEISSLNELSGRMSLVIYNGEAVVIIGAHSEDDEEDYQDMADYLADLTNSDKIITSNDVTSKDFKSLF